MAFKSQVFTEPSNRTIRLSRDTWAHAEALSLADGGGSMRTIAEDLIEQAVLDRLSDPEFVEIYKAVRAKEMNNGKGEA